MTFAYGTSVQSEVADIHLVVAKKSLKSPLKGNCTIVFRGKIVFMSNSTIVFTK